MRFRGVWFGSVTLVCALAVPALASAAVSFVSSPYPLPVAGSEYLSRVGAVSVVDLNNDSHPDVVVYRGGGNVGKLFVLLNQGAGTFAAAQEYPVCANPDGGTMVTGEFNAGQAADVIVGCEAGRGFDELLGNGDGTLADAVYFTGFSLNNAISLWPSDTGGFPDLLYSQSAGEQYLCYRPTNDLASPVCPPDTSASDVNGPSGHASIGPDLATAHFYSSTCPQDDVIVSPYLRSVRAWGLNPFGTMAVPPCSSFAYTERELPLPADVVLAGISTGDLNGDGTPDLLMNGGPQGNGDRLVALIWQNNAADLGGGFPPGQQPVVTASVPGIEDQQVADFDGDGILDAAVEGNSGAATTGTLAVHRGHGDGSFDTPPATFAIPGGTENVGPNRFAVGDLNGDGRPDVVSVAMDDPSVTVLLNSTPKPPASIPGSPSSPPALVADTTAPALGQVKLTNTKFAVGSAATALTASVKRGTTLRYTLSESARVTITITRRDSGRRKGKKCVKPTRRLQRARRCKRDTLKGTLTRTGTLGANALAFSGRIGTKKLPPGNYRMGLVATDTANNKSSPTQLAFVILGG